MVVRCADLQLLIEQWRLRRCGRCPSGVPLPVRLRVRGLNVVSIRNAKFWSGLTAVVACGSTMASLALSARPSDTVLVDNGHLAAMSLAFTPDVKQEFLEGGSCGTDSQNARITRNLGAIVQQHCWRQRLGSRVAHCCQDISTSVSNTPATLQQQPIKTAAVRLQVIIRSCYNYTQEHQPQTISYRRENNQPEASRDGTATIEHKYTRTCCAVPILHLSTDEV